MEIKLRDVSRITGTAVWLGLVLLIAHELDAVARHEWRLLPGFAFVDDDVARDLFVLLHIPLLATIFWAMTHHHVGLRSAGRTVIAALLVIHGGLHFLLSGDALYEFQGIVAHVTIYGATLAGAAYLVLRAIEQK